jgi:site-specific DNA-adenine methylase
MKIPELPAIPADMQVTAVANWFGSERLVREAIARKLHGCTLVVIPFAGGMGILPLIAAKKIIVNDLHRHVINLARVMGDPILGPKLYRALRRLPFTLDALHLSQCSCIERRDLLELLESPRALFRPAGDVSRLLDPLGWAMDYAVCSWMSRGGQAGTPGEFSGSLPVRYSPNGGGSGQRFHNWVASLPAWRRVLRRCEFESCDYLEVLNKAHDDPKVGIYIDAPWPGAGEGYVHRFSNHRQCELATRLGEFKRARVVLRYGDHPLIRQLYPEKSWLWELQPGRDQANGEISEVIITRRQEI